MNSTRRILLIVLAIVALGALAFVTSVQLTGNAPGEPCADSYSCEGFLIGGAECVDEGSSRYCSRYCDADADCPEGWRCLSARPTALTIETDVLDEVCIRP